MKKIIYSIAILATTIFIASCGSNNQAPAADNAPKYRTGVDFVYNAFNSGNPDGIDSFIDVNFIEHTPPPGMDVKGIEGFKNMLKMNHEGFPDTKITILDYFENGDIAVVRFNWKGTNSGPMMGMPATNKAIDCEGMDMMKFVNGKCTEHWGYFEETKMMTQLGLMPPMTGTPADTGKAN